MKNKSIAGKNVMPRCSVCENNKFENILKIENLRTFSSLKNIPFSEKRKFDALLYRCKRCGFVQQNPSSRLQNFLTSFYTKEESFITAPPSVNTFNNRTKFNIAFLKKHIKGQVKSVLEIGCYDGYFLDLLRKNLKVKEAVGIEVSRLKKKFPKLKIVHEYYPTTKVKGKKFDLVVIMNVLEHIFSPRDFMMAIRENLGDNGKVLMEIPNEEPSFRLGMLTFQHQHINYFTPITIKTFLSNLGFKIDGIYTKDLDRIFLVCSKCGVSNKTQILEDKSSIGYKLRQQKLMKRFIKMTKSDSPIGLYGACNFTHNLLQIVGVGSNVSIFDGDDRKKGKFMSDVKTGIKSWSEIDPSNVKKLIIMPFAFTSEILKFLIFNKIKTPIKRVFPLHNI